MERDLKLRDSVLDLELRDPQAFAAFITRVPGGVSLDVYRQHKHGRPKMQGTVCHQCLYGQHLVCEQEHCGCFCRP